jgi:hypothetical protein
MAPRLDDVLPQAKAEPEKRKLLAKPSGLLDERGLGARQPLSSAP